MNIRASFLSHLPLSTKKVKKKICSGPFMFLMEEKKVNGKCEDMKLKLKAV